MLQFEKFSPETVSELLIFLAENERFDSLKSIKNISKNDVSSLLKDLATQINEITSKKTVMTQNTFSQKELPEAIHKIISKLTPQEESLLLRSFRVS